MGKRPWMVRLPLWFHYAFAGVVERVMQTPLVSRSQIRMLSEGLAEPLPPAQMPPDDLAPRIPFTDEQIRNGLPVH